MTTRPLIACFFFCFFFFFLSLFHWSAIVLVDLLSLQLTFSKIVHPLDLERATKEITQLASVMQIPTGERETHDNQPDTMQPPRINPVRCSSLIASLWLSLLPLLFR